MIVTAVGGNPEAVIDGETGLVVPPSDPKAIGSAILRLAADPALRKCFGAAGRSRAKSEFSLERCVTLQAKLYEELLANTGLRVPTPQATWISGAHATSHAKKKAAYVGLLGTLRRPAATHAGVGWSVAAAWANRGYDNLDLDD